jgi:hypothetical protein
MKKFRHGNLSIEITSDGRFFHLYRHGNHDRIVESVASPIAELANLAKVSAEAHAAITPTQRAVSIVINRAEGPTALCGPAGFEGPDCWAEANAWLRGQALTVPDGSMHKCDVTISFGPEWRYSGEYELRLRHTPLQDWARRSWEYYAKRRIPRHMTPAQRDSLHEAMKIDSAEWERILNTYEIPEAP